MAATYTPITLQELQALLKSEKGWVITLPDVGEAYMDFQVKQSAMHVPRCRTAAASQMAHQIIKSTSIIIRVYTSVTAGGVREAGADAIRVCVLANYAAGYEVPSYKGVRTFKRVHRTQNWADNLKARVQEAYAWAKTRLQICPNCGQLMVVRQPHEGGSEFWGCLGYPACKHTEKLE